MTRDTTAAQDRSDTKNELICEFLTYWNRGVVPSQERFMEHMDEYARTMHEINKKYDGV